MRNFTTRISHTDFNLRHNTLKCRRTAPFDREVKKGCERLNREHMPQKRKENRGCYDSI